VSFDNVFVGTRSKSISHISRTYERTLYIKFQFGRLKLSSIFMGSIISEFLNKFVLHWTITFILGIRQWTWGTEEHIRRKFIFHAVVYGIHARNQSENNRVLHSHESAFWSDDGSFKSTYFHHKTHVNLRAHLTFIKWTKSKLWDLKSKSLTIVTCLLIPSRCPSSPHYSI